MRSNAMEQLVNQFVEDLAELLHSAEDEGRTAALAIVTSMLGTSSPRPRPRAAAPHGSRAAPKRRDRDHDGPAEASRSDEPAHDAEDAPAPTALAPRRHPRITAVPIGPTRMPLAPLPAASPALPAAADSDSEPPSRVVDATGNREALVLASVRALVRPTAGEVAQHSGLPNATAYVLLRALVASGRVARTDTIRGIEYSLVSPGHVQPFRRARL